jgi:GT2 family glycosyltransferase
MVINRGEGETDIGQFEKPQEVFGVSGACALYRIAALQDVAIHNEYFDQDFFAYKEDIDLAWRLRWYGYESWYCPTARAYHYRGLSAPATPGVMAKIMHRRGISKRLRILSFRNHHLMLIKNDRFGLLGTSIFSLLFVELKWLGALLIEPFQWKTLFSIFGALPRTWAKRTIIKRHSRVTMPELRKWFV